MWRRLLRRSLRVAVSLLVRTLPMFRTAQTLHNTDKLPNKRLTYTALWAPPGVDHCATWLEPTALLLLMRRYGYPMRVIETVLSQYTPPSYLIYLLASARSFA